MWSTACLSDPVFSDGHATSPLTKSFVVHAKAPLSLFLCHDNEFFEAFQQGGRPAQVAVADFCSRVILNLFRKNELVNTCGGYQFDWETLDYTGPSRRSNKHNSSGSQTPYILERTDFWTSNDDLNIMLRARISPISQGEEEKKNKYLLICQYQGR